MGATDAQNFQSRSQTHIDLYRLGDSILGLSGAHVKSLIFLLRRFPAGISPEIESIDSLEEYLRMNLPEMVGKRSRTLSDIGGSEENPVISSRDLRLI